MAFPLHPNIPTKLYHLPTGYGKVLDFTATLRGNVGAGSPKPVVPIIIGGRRYAVAFATP